MLGDTSNLEERVLKLERDLARLKDDPSVGQILAPGKFGLKWPARIQGPNGDAYIIIREPAGWLTTAPASDFSKADWTDDESSLDLTVADLTADSLSVGDIEVDTLEVAETADFTGPVTMADDLDVTGDATVGGALAVTGASTFTGALAASNITFTGTIDGDASSALYVTDAQVEGIFRHTGSNIQFFNKGVDQTKLAVSGTVTAGTLAQLQTAFHSLVDALEAYGLVTDSTT